MVTFFLLVMKEFVNNFLESISLLTVLVAFAIRYKSWFGLKGMKLLFVFFLLAFFNTGVAAYLAYIDTVNTLWYNLHGFCRLAVLSLFFFKILKGRYQKAFALWGGMLGLIIFLAILFYWDDNIAFFSPGYAIGSLLIITFCLLYLQEELTGKMSVYSEPRMWIVCALLAYNLGSFLILVSYKFLTHNYMSGKMKDTFFTPGNLWGVHNVILFLSCIAIALILSKGKALRADQQ